MSIGGGASETASGAVETIRRRIREDYYGRLTDKLLDEGGWDDEIELATASRMSAEAHENRTVLELVQNARDAIREEDPSGNDGVRDGSVAVVVGPETLYVANTGKRFCLDDEDVLKRVRRLGEGKDNDEEDTIGEKGVGMRSIIALGERFGIHSTISDDKPGSYFSVDFSGAHPWAMLARRYEEILQSALREPDDDRLGELGEAETLEGLRKPLEAVTRKLTESASEHPTLEDSDQWPDTDAIIEAADRSPPESEAVIGNLHEFSPFRYPYVQDGPPDDRILNTLLGRSGQDSKTNEALADRLSEERYTTVVSVDYSDDSRDRLLQLFIEAFEEAGADIDVPVDEWRQARDQAAEDKPEQVWEECRETITEEVLILLGEIGTIDLVRVNDSEEDKPAKSCSYTIANSGSSGPGRTDELHSKQVSVTEDPAPGSLSHEGDESKFHLYEKTWEGSPTDDDAGDCLKVLFEHPRPGQDWRPRQQPLHLYYPIEGELTPFPFVVHAPFEVKMDRQSLDGDHPKNEALLSEGVLERFVAEIVEDIMASGTELRGWLPWLVMPLSDNDDGPTSGDDGSVADFVDTLCDRLSETACIPTFGGGQTEPDQVLLEVEDLRLDAFEPVRNYVDGPHERLPEEDVIEKGRKLLETVIRTEEDEGAVLPADRLREAVERIGLTELLSQFPDEDAEGPQEGFVSVLGNIWGIDSGQRRTDPDVAIEVEDSDAARAYFETVITRISEGDETPAQTRAASELGSRRIPLLPAIEYAEKSNEDLNEKGDRSEELGASDEGGDGSTGSSDGEQIGHLVRAIPRSQNEEPGVHRIVFREGEKETQRELGSPPSTFDVFLVPYEGNWHEALETNAREWGTRKYNGDTDIYRRVAAELGGYKNDIEIEGRKQAALDYLYDGYRHIADGKDTRAEFLHPIPFQGRHYHKRFSNSVDTRGIGDHLQGEKLTSVDDDTFLQGLYLNRIEVPTRDDGWRPADETVFGRAWTDIFRAVGDALETEDVEDPFEDTRPGDTSSPDDFRRWASAIDRSAEIRGDDEPVLAPPGEICTRFGPDALWEQDKVDIAEADSFWLLNFLVHIGVQVGPRIEWAWVSPAKSEEATGRPRDLSTTEAKELAEGSVPESTDVNLPLTPERTELKQYARVCRRARNHPAFVVNHAPDCGDGAEGSYDEWSIYDNGSDGDSLVIPMWWRFTDLPSDPDPETADAFRNAVLLLWPELSDRLFPTGWACAGAFGNNHQVKSPRDWIPSLGLVQLRRAKIWPRTGEDSADKASATALVDAKRTQKLSKLDYEELQDGFPVKDGGDVGGLELNDLISESSLSTWLGISLNELAPAAAAERLDLLLDGFDGPEYSSYRKDVFKLLRRFRSEDHLGVVSDSDDRRLWRRRDIYHTCTKLLVNRNGKPETVRIGASEQPGVIAYQSMLPSYAEELKQGPASPYIDLPSRDPGPIADVLADDEGDVYQFGIDKEQVPERPKLSAHADVEDVDDSFRERLRRRVPDLAAALASEMTIDEEEVRDCEKKLAGAVENICRASEEQLDVGGVGESLKSVKWDLDDDRSVSEEGIALISENIGDEPKLHHVVDALVHITENEGVRDNLEVVLRADPRMERYQDTRVEYGLGNIKQNKVERLLGNCLPDVEKAVVDTISESDRTSTTQEYEQFMPDDEDRANTIHDNLKRFVESGSTSEYPVEGILLELVEGPLTREQAEATLEAAVELAVYRVANPALATLIDMLTEEGVDVAEGMQRIADGVEVVNLSDWRTVNASRLRDYLTAIAIVEEFYKEISTDLDENGIRTKAGSVQSKVDRLELSPLDALETVLPEAVRATLGLDRRLPVIVFELLDELGNETVISDRQPSKDEHRAALAQAVTGWCEFPFGESDMTADVSLDDWRLCEPMGRWPEEDALSPVKRKLESEQQSTKRQLTRTREQKKRDFDKGETFGKVETNVDAGPEDVEFPEVGGRNHGGHSNSTVPAGDGRTGELKCVEMAWERFEAAGSRQGAIIEEIRRWRDGPEAPHDHQWRMKQTSDVFDDEEAFVDSTQRFDFEEFKRRLCDPQGDDEDDVKRRTWFRMLVDVSEESGPGFDYIDPFGLHYDEESDPERWDPAWMRRVEVKSVDGNPGEGYRVKLTGNEFRMARRTCGACGGPRYLVRFVFGTRNGGDFNPEETRDIDDVLTKYKDDVEDRTEVEAHAWDALRGGRLPLTGSFE